MADDDSDVAFMPMALIDAGYNGGYTYELKKWSSVKTGFTKMSAGDIAYAKITPCFQNRKSFILTSAPNNTAAATTELNVLRLYGETFDRWYILFFLKSEYFIRNAKYKGTAGQQRVLSSYVSEKLVPIPPYAEQRRIVERINLLLRVVEKYELHQYKLSNLEKELLPSLKKSILQYAIQGKLVPQNPEDEPASELLKRIEDEKSRLVKAGKIKRDKNTSVIFKGEDNKYYEKLGSKVSDITDDIPFDIPDSWQWCRLSTLANLYTGNSINESDKKKYYTDVEGLEYIATKDLSFEGRFCYKNGVAIPESHLSEFRIAPKGAVLMCIEGGSAGRKVGQLEQDVCFGNKLCCFAPYADISEYILYYLQSPIFYDIFTSSKSGIIGGVSVNNLKQLLVPLPPYSEIRRIVPAIRKVLKSIEG